MRAGSVGVIALALLLSADVPCSGQKGSGLTVTPSGDRVTVGGLEPGAGVALVGVIRKVFGTIPGHERWNGFATADGSGTATVILEEEVEANRSVWIAVRLDVSNTPWAMSDGVIGGIPLAAPAETQVPAGPHIWQIPKGKVEVMVARPGDFLAPSIWAVRVFDGGLEDYDPAAGSVGVAASSLEEIAGPGLPFGDFSPLDLLVAIEPESLRVWVARVVEEER